MKASNSEKQFTYLLRQPMNIKFILTIDKKKIYSVSPCHPGVKVLIIPYNKLNVSSMNATDKME